jgi:hypothetical protein
MSRCVNVEVKNHEKYTNEMIMDKMIRILKNKLNKEKTFQILRRHNDSFNHRHLKKIVSNNRRKRIERIIRKKGD